MISGYAFARPAFSASMQNSVSHALPVAFTAWYNKKGQATFSDIIAFVRRSIWAKKYFNDSWFEGDYVKIKRDEWESLIDQLARMA